MLVKCQSCGKFFGAEKADQKMCSACSVTGQRLARHIADSEDPKFSIARDIVYDNPSISPEELKRRMSEINVDISIKEIMGYVRDGRLSMVAGVDAQLCEECGKPILGGRLCPRCSSNLSKAITKTQEPKPVQREEVRPQGPIMHTKK